MHIINSKSYSITVIEQQIIGCEKEEVVGALMLRE
jgi:hypothetical protein